MCVCGGGLQIKKKEMRDLRKRKRSERERKHWENEGLSQEDPLQLLLFFFFTFFTKEEKINVKRPVCVSLTSHDDINKTKMMVK